MITRFAHTHLGITIDEDTKNFLASIGKGFGILVLNPITHIVVTIFAIIVAIWFFGPMKQHDKALMKNNHQVQERVITTGLPN